MMLRAMRFLGAMAILAVGAIHLQQYIGADYRTVPTIGTLFLLNAIGSAIVGVALLLPLERLLPARKARTVIALLAMGGVAIATGSLVSLFISESGSLFGFTEHGYRSAIVIAIIAEGATVLLLSPVAASKLVQTFSIDERRPPHGRETASLGSGRARRAAFQSGGRPR
jgi:hypothetical protein